MPQFDIETASGEQRTVRARDEADACARAGLRGALVAPEADVQGWRDVVVGDEPAGRVRPHSRMRFRRD